MSTVILKPNEFVIRVEEGQTEVRYVLAKTPDDCDSNAMSHIMAMMLAFSKISKKKSPHTNKTDSDEDDMRIERYI